MSRNEVKLSDQGIRGMVTVATAAEMLRVSSRRVLQFLKDGRLKGEQVTPRMWLIDASDVATLAKTNRPRGRPVKKA